MLLAVVVVKIPVGLIQNLPPPKAVALKPTGMLNPVIAAVPLTSNRGHEGVIKPAAEATVVVDLGDWPARGLSQLGTHVLVIVEQSH